MSSEAWHEYPVTAGRLFLIDWLQLPSTAFKVGDTWSGKPSLSALLRSVSLVSGYHFTCEMPQAPMMAPCFGGC